MKVVLDSNIYDKCAQIYEIQCRVRELILAGKIEILISPTIYDELCKSPFNGVPNFFPGTYIGESVFVAGGRVGDRVGTGEILDEHLGDSKKVADAFIADLAATDAEYLVSEDKRLRIRLNAIQSWCKAIDFLTFTSIIEQLKA
jgi:predicted nucleic acid-binding protein